MSKSIDLHTASYADFRRRLLFGFGLLLAMLLLALAWKLRASYLDDRRSAQMLTKNFVQAMDAHVSNAIQFVDLALIGSADALKTLQPEQLRTPGTVRALLAASGRTPDNNFWLIFLGADGNGVVASNGLAINGVPYLDRPYFTAHAQGTDIGLFVGAPEIGKVSRRRLFFLSRAVRSPGGAFLGVVAAPVDAGVLARVFQSALFEPGLAVTLAHADGKTIARAPLFEQTFASDLTTSPLFAKMKDGPSGTYEAKSILDGRTRVYSYRRLGGLPLVVTVGMAEQSWTTRLVDDGLVAGVGLAVILVILLVSGRFALASYQRLEASGTVHRQLNEELQAARQRLTDSESRMRMVTDHIPTLVSYIDADQRYVFRNAAYSQVRGLDAETMVGKTLLEVHGAANYRLVADQLARALGGQSVVFDCSVTLQGAVHQWKIAFTPDLGDGSSVVGVYAMVTDMTERMRVEDVLRSQARIDALTGLPNRQQLYERLSDAFARCTRMSTLLACLYLDIDHFKQINDTLGHGAGDELLKQFAARLQANVRQTDLVARIAGDEFVVVSEGIQNVSDAEFIARKIIAAMQVPFTIEGEDRIVTTSIGVAVTEGRDHDPDSLLKQADRQLYLAKRMGKNRFTVYDPVSDGAVRTDG